MAARSRSPRAALNTPETSTATQSTAPPVAPSGRRPAANRVSSPPACDGPAIEQQRTLEYAAVAESMSFDRREKAFRDSISAKCNACTYNPILNSSSLPVRHRFPVYFRPDLENMLAVPRRLPGFDLRY